MGAPRKHKSYDGALAELVQRYDSAKGDYQAAKRTRFNQRRKNIPHSGGSGDYHIRNEYEYFDLVESSYDLERNDAVVGQLIDRRTTNVIQDGFRYEPNTGDKVLDIDLKQRWEGWADNPDECDISGEACFHDFEYAADWTQCLAGDCGISLTEDGPLQFFEPFLIRNDYGSHHDDIFLGVEMDDDRKRHAYWIAEDAIDPYDISFTNFTPIDTRDVDGNRQFFHIYNRKRMTLTRGVTALAPVFELTGMLEDVAFAKLVQQQMVSCITFLVKEEMAHTELPSTGKSGTGSGIGTEASNPPNFNTPRAGNPLFKELMPGAEVNPGPGRTVEGFSPQIPNAEYFQQHRQILQMICGNLELPLAVGMLDGSETNFHGFIGAINEAKKLWKRSQRRLIKQFHRPVVKGKIRHFMAEDRALRQAAKRSDINILKGKWHTPVWKSVQPLQDTNDRLIRLRNGITSPAKLQAELDVDFEDHVNETIDNNAYAIVKAKKKAAKINAKFDDGQPVHWNQIYPVPMPDGIQATTEMIDKEIDRENAIVNKPEVAA